MYAHRVESARTLANIVAGREATLGVERGELVPFRNIEIPSAVPPSSRVNIRASVGNEADLIVPGFERDICTSGGFNGFLIETSVAVDGRSRGTLSQCIPAGGEQDFDFSFVSGEPGTEHTVQVRTRGARTGNQLNSQEFTVAVTEEAPEPPQPDDMETPGGPFRPFLCFLNPVRSCNFREQVAMGGTFGFVFLVLLLGLL